jgi:CheY-like chemotaxis protein
LKVVVVEDNQDIMDIVSFILKDDGHEVYSSIDGSILQKFETIKPDLILLDELLPGLRGSELCKQIKADCRFKHIPVLLISTIPYLDRIAAQCGADGWLEKPFNIDSFSELIQKYASL